MTRCYFILAVLFALTSAVGCGPSDDEVAVVLHRCGDLNMDSLAGTFGRLDGEQSINSKFRIRFAREGEQVLATYVAGGLDERFSLVGRRTGNESMDFVEQGQVSQRKRRLKVSLNAKCRLDVADGWVSGPAAQPTEVDHPSSPHTFVAFDLSRLDFAPCTERLALGRAARSKAPGKLSAVGEVPVITADSLTLAQWSPSSVIPQGCVPQVDLWVNGEAEIIDMPIEVNGQRVHWRVDYETRFLGKKGLALHREVKCQNETRLLAVACANIEVR
ncbi:MAG: hypothetical protein CMP23_06970 [Rickettsiales bacterium]|nr:hypothetical protein [Rickettsiales bacterium]